MQTNSNVTKFNKQVRFDYEEAQERTTNGRKLNKQKRQSSKREQWDDQE